jgi:hypothetical protein
MARHTTKRATRLLRKTIRQRLQSEFEDFARDANDEEVWFLEAVLNIRSSMYSDTPPEVAIAAAFEDCITNRAGYYIAIKDEKLLAAVKEFMRKYVESDGRLSPLADGWCLWRADARRVGKPGLKLGEGSVAS